MKKKLVAILSAMASLAMFAGCADLLKDPTSSNSTPDESSSTACTHVYDNACDADCNVCGEERTPSEHVYDADCDTDCNVCGETREAGEHTYADTLTMGIATHWYAATCGHSDVKKDEAAHIWGEGEVTTEPGLEKGERTYTCECGATKTEELPATKANVVYYVGEEPIYTETVDIGATVAYAEEPTKENYIFAGWFNTAEDAATPTVDKIFNAATVINETTNLYAGFAQTSVTLPAVFAQYQQGTEIATPSVNVSFLGAAVETNIAVVAPSGADVTVSENKWTLDEVGEYVITYTAKVKGSESTYELKVNSVDVLEYMATNNATVNTDGAIPGGWETGMLEVSLGEGGSATLNTVIDWTGKTLDNAWFGYQGAFDKMTAAEYKDKDFTITFTNVENAAQTLALKHTIAEDNQIFVIVNYNGESVWSYPIGKFMGSDVVDVWGRLFTVKFYEGGIDINGSNIALTNFFTKAVVSMSSTTGSAAAFAYIANARGWLAMNGYAAVSSTNTIVSTSATIPGWNYAALGMTIAAGDSVRINTPISWAGKTLSNNWYAFSLYFTQLTAEEYVGKDVTITLTNPNNEGQTLSIRVEVKENNLLYVTATYNGTVFYDAEIDAYAGSDLDMELKNKCFITKTYEGGCAILGNLDQQNIELQHFFNSAYVSVSSESGITVAFGYIGDAMGWQ